MANQPITDKKLFDRIAKLQKYTIELLRVTKLDFPIIGDIAVKEEDWSTHNFLESEKYLPFIQMEHDFIPSASINHGCDVLVFGVTKRKTIKGFVFWDMPAVMVLTCACHGMDPETGYWDEDWHVRGVFTNPAAAVTSIVTRLVEDVVQNNYAYPLEGSDL